MNNLSAIDSGNPGAVSLGSRRRKVYHQAKQLRPVSKALPLNRKAGRVFNLDQNITFTESIIRVLCIPGLALCSAIAWYLMPAYVFLLIPIRFYLIVTAFTLYCPVKEAIRYLRQHPAQGTGMQ